MDMGIISTAYLAFMYVTSLAMLTFTALPFTGSHAWWIRVMDFPRFHYIAVILPLLVAAWWLPSWHREGIMLILGGCLAYQFWRVLPYTPFVPKEIRFASEGNGDDVVTLMSSNVLMENRDYAAVRRVIEENDPDILFLMEIDQTWLDAMEPALEGYETVIRHPKDNYYGLVFATRLKMHEVRVAYLTQERTPTLFSELETDDGKRFRFVGMHPKPPTPGVDTEERDDQLFYAARFARDSNLPVVIMGDFNAVAWSHVAHKFKSVGRYLDPRIGRGPLPSFDANHRIMRFPIDQLYITPDIALISFGRGENVGSDHFPMFAKLRFDPEQAERLNKRLVPLPEDVETEIETRIARHRARLDAVMDEVEDERTDA
ncbi:endonuclease/exonuclease/phosphatase family protein [Profundibacterium mesophilum]|uniref:Endonuclease/Exonuclease/phosphatase family domain containing protein n=1 Tax=Profundibacterium mesophilum KAUST100406-0324 TaxID=1037889 RepID=A0A921NQK7_9RHOB|nr:endonuclease/exonuclease/phosphatase family protein [Profundibacterium mesophilum]KAF0675437.1 Endonuclease/Exonuclease/phosphatase family domain containing protein [Profundibacterium mesophilum KAUST100406-0324]